MDKSTSPLAVTEVVATLADIFRHQGRSEVVELLENAHAYFDQTEYDNWNGGTSTWALRLEVPVRIVASLEPRLPEIEKEVGAKLSYWDRQFSNDHFGEVTVSPISDGSSPTGQRMTPSESDVRRLWSNGRFRLFLSHVSKHRVGVSQLKAALWLRGVDAFVAHEDIEPSLEWQREIELGLRSMHALAALMTPDFHESKWTDHEVGWALGREVAVVPVRLGADPYGLAGKFQGVTGAFDKPEMLAFRIAETLLSNRHTGGEMRRALFSSFAAASSREMATALHHLLLTVDNVTNDEREALWKACTSNVYVSKADGVVDGIYAAFGAPKIPEEHAVADDIPF